MTEVVYNAEPTPRLFHQSDEFVRSIMGPIGSGKSVACCWEIFLRAMAQKPHEDGVRRSRWVIIRNTYRELIDTTMQTWFDWFPKHMGEYQAGNMKFIIYKPLEDGTKLYLEVLFRALDKPDDIKKLLSLELTGGWLNEAREIPKAVLDMLVGRLGRYPSKRLGGPSWFGCILDTNPPDSDHWWYRTFEEIKPEGYRIWHQPSGLAPQAENIEHLPEGYYQKMQAGKDQEWINVYVHGNYGFLADGRPIYPEYNDDIHSTDEELLLLGGTVYVGIDFGLTPAAVIAQRTAKGQWQFLDELVTDDMGAKKFAVQLNHLLNNKYCGCDLEIYGDPAGEQRSQTDETTPFQILSAANIEAWPAPTNDFTIRREAVAQNLQQLTMDGQPQFLIGSRCPMLRRAMGGGYKYKRLKVSGEERYHDKPDKNKYSHVAEAGQYLMVGAGEGDRVIENRNWSKELDYSNLNRAVV